MWERPFSQWRPMVSLLAVSSRRQVISCLSLPALTHLPFHSKLYSNLEPTDHSQLDPPWEILLVFTYILADLCWCIRCFFFPFFTFMTCIIWFTWFTTLSFLFTFTILAYCIWGITGIMQTSLGQPSESTGAAWAMFPFIINTINASNGM